MASIIIKNLVTNDIITGSEPTPLVFLGNQKCDEQLEIQFSEAFGPNAGEYSNPVWEIFGPHDEPLGWTFDAGSGAGAFGDPAYFTIHQPGRYLFRLTALPFSANSTTQFTALVEVRDSQIVGTSYSAPNETDEYDSDEGWAYPVQRYHEAVSKLYVDKSIFTVKADGSGSPAVAIGKPVMPTDDYWQQWNKADVNTAADYKNLVITVEEATAEDVDVLTKPVFILLEELTPGADGNGRATAAWFGLFPMDVTGEGWAAGDPLFVEAAANGGGFTNVPPAGDPPYAREIGRVVKTGPGLPNTPGVLASMPGIIWVFGMGTDQIPGMIAGPLASTDNAIATWDGTFGNALQDTNVIVNDPSDPFYVAETDANPADGVGDGYGGTSTIAAKTLGQNWGVAGNSLVVRTGDMTHAGAVPGALTVRAGQNTAAAGSGGVGGAVHILAGYGDVGGNLSVEAGLGATSGAWSKLAEEPELGMFWATCSCSSTRPI